MYLKDYERDIDCGPFCFDHITVLSNCISKGKGSLDSKEGMLSPRCPPANEETDDASQDNKIRNFERRRLMVHLGGLSSILPSSERTRATIARFVANGADRPLLGAGITRLAISPLVASLIQSGGLCVLVHVAYLKNIRVSQRKIK